MPLCESCFQEVHEGHTPIRLSGQAPAQNTPQPQAQSPEPPQTSAARTSTSEKETTPAPESQKLEDVNVERPRQEAGSPPSSTEVVRRSSVSVVQANPPARTPLGEAETTLESTGQSNTGIARGRPSTDSTGTAFSPASPALRGDASSLPSNADLTRSSFPSPLTTSQSSTKPSEASEMRDEMPKQQQDQSSAAGAASMLSQSQPSPVLDTFVSSPAGVATVVIPTTGSQTMPQTVLDELPSKQVASSPDANIERLTSQFNQQMQLQSQIHAIQLEEQARHLEKRVQKLLEARFAESAAYQMQAEKRIESLQTSIQTQTARLAQLIAENDRLRHALEQSAVAGSGPAAVALAAELSVKHSTRNHVEAPIAAQAQALAHSSDSEPALPVSESINPADRKLLTKADFLKSKDELLSEIAFLRRTLMGKDASFRRLIKFKDWEYALHDQRRKQDHIAAINDAYNMAHTTALQAALQALKAPPSSATAKPSEVESHGQRELYSRIRPLLSVVLAQSRLTAREVIASATARTQLLEAQVRLLRGLLMRLPPRVAGALAPEIADFQLLMSTSKSRQSISACKDTASISANAYPDGSHADVGDALDESPRFKTWLAEAGATAMEQQENRSTGLRQQRGNTDHRSLRHHKTERLYLDSGQAVLHEPHRPPSSYVEHTHSTFSTLGKQRQKNTDSFPQPRLRPDHNQEEYASRAESTQMRRHQANTRRPSVQATNPFNEHAVGRAHAQQAHHIERTPNGIHKPSASSNPSAIIDSDSELDLDIDSGRQYDSYFGPDEPQSIAAAAFGTRAFDSKRRDQ